MLEPIEQRDAARLRSDIIWGIIELFWLVFFLGVSLAAFLAKGRVLDLHDLRDLWQSFWRYWPAIWPANLFMMGLATFVGPLRRDGRRNGGWLMFMGVLGALLSARVLRWDESWQVLIVVIGGSLVYEAVWRSRELRPREEPDCQARPGSPEEAR